MAQKLLCARDDIIKLGLNWIQRFFHRHPGLKLKYSRILNQERYLTEDLKVIKD